MAMNKDLLCANEDGTLNFGNHMLTEKAKVDDFMFQGDLLKVKSFQKMTKFEKNGSFVFESVPGTTVNNFKETEDGIFFAVEGNEDVQIIIGLEEQTEYNVEIAGESAGRMTTNLSGKLNLSVDLSTDNKVEVAIVK
ncbi:MAG: endosialidase [Lachnospiraceae bacterium]